MFRTLWQIAAVAVLVLSMPDVSAASYNFTDIGPLSYPVVDINNSGVLTGSVTLPHGTERGFTWTASTGFAYLEPLVGYTNSRGLRINDSSQVVGTSILPSGSNTTLWNEDGQAFQVDLGDFSATDINNIGQVVGGSYLWSESAGRETISLDAYAYAVNDHGVVVGQYGSQGFLWTRDGGMQLIDSPISDGPGITAVAVNNSGQVVCQTFGSGGGMAYLWDGNELMPLLPGGEGVRAMGINNLGQVVGYHQYTPFVWDAINGIEYLPMPPSLYTIGGAAYAINDGGMIVGWATDGDYRNLLLWQPVPEPSSLLALGGGAFGLAAMALRRRIRSKS